jgi:hypothetical protein
VKQSSPKCAPSLPYHVSGAAPAPGSLSPIRLVSATTPMALARSGRLITKAQRDTTRPFASAGPSFPHAREILEQVHNRNATMRGKKTHTAGLNFAALPMHSSEEILIAFLIVYRVRAG